jgi:hypothetical protein
MLQITERRRFGIILAIFVVSALVLIALAVTF